MPHDPLELKRQPLGSIGLGLMGSAIAERLLERGFRVLVWNRTREKARPLIRRGAEWCDNPLAVCERIIVCLYTTEVVRQVLDHMQEGLHAGQIVLDLTTGEPVQTAALGASLAARGVQYLDAPISGSSEQARRGEVTIIAGGHRSAFEACADLWSVIGKKVFYVGPCGSAAKMKLVSNLVLGLNRAALAEGLVFAEAMGLEPRAALEVLTGSMAYSRVMDVKGLKMLAGDFTAQARLSQHLKDVRIILDTAERAELPLPLSQVHRRLLEQAERAGLGDLDNSAIIRVLRRRDAGSAR